MAFLVTPSHPSREAPSARSVLAIDPGPERSAWLLWDGRVVDFGIWPNETLIEHLRRQTAAETVVIEKVESFGMAVGAEVFATVHWGGQFTEAAYRPREFGRSIVQLPRKAIKLHLCGNLRAKDPNIRQALIDRFGGPSAIGRKASPGPLYGISKDVWSALAIAVTYADGAA